jgi:hypothetical protein
MKSKLVFIVIAGVLLYYLFGRSSTSATAGSPASPSALANPVTSGISGIFAGTRPAIPRCHPRSSPQPTLQTLPQPIRSWPMQA